MHERLWELVNKNKVRCLVHKAYVKSLPCHVQKDLGDGMKNCNRKPIDSHHLTLEGGRGMTVKESDEWQVPVCRFHHSALTDHANEADFWRDMGMEYPHDYAIELSLSSPSRKIRIAMQQWRLENVEQ